MKTVCFVFLFVFCEDMSVKEGENVTLSTDVKQPNETMKWYFNDTLIALINGEASKSCLYDGEGGIFRGRLQVDYETGSLTITNIRPEHTGRYEANIIRSNSTGKLVSLNRTSKCDSTKINKKSSNSGDTIKTFNVNTESLKGSGLSPGEIAGIVAGVVGGVGVLVVAAAVGVRIYCRRSSRNEVL